jgi:hypothetical protein
MVRSMGLKLVACHQLAPHRRFLGEAHRSQERGCWEEVWDSGARLGSKGRGWGKGSR